MKSPRNKTIDMSVDEGREYLGRCIRVDRHVALPDIIDRTITGDTFSVLPLLPEKIADLIIVDPPYNIEKDFHGSRFHALSDDEYERYTESWIALIKPLLKDNGSIYVCCDWKSSLVIGRVLDRHFFVRNRITWQREKGRGASRNWKNSMEDIWFATNSQDYIFNVDKVMHRRRVIAPYKVDDQPRDWEETGAGRFRNTHPSNFWDDVSVPYWSMSENTAHPTQKPEKLLAKLILASSDEGGLILDPFAGSGSTAVTAKKLGRHFVSVEQSELYCVWAERRLEMAQSDTTIQGYSQGVFWERNTSAVQKKPQGD